MGTAWVCFISPPLLPPLPFLPSFPSSPDTDSASHVDERSASSQGDVADLALAADIIRAAADMAERHRTWVLHCFLPLQARAHSPCVSTIPFAPPFQTLTLLLPIPPSPSLSTLPHPPPHTHLQPTHPFPMHIRHYTFYCGQPGILAMGAVVQYHLNHHSQQQQQQHEELDSNPYLRSFLSLLTSALPSLSLLPSSPTDTAPATIPHELLYGRAGMLWAFLFLRRNLPVEMRRKLLPLSLARPIAAAIVDAGLSLASTYNHGEHNDRKVGYAGRDCLLSRLKSHLENGDPSPPLMYEWYDTRYLGAAHGVAGIAHVLLLLRREELEEELEELEEERGTTAGVGEAAMGGGSAREKRDRTLEEAAEAAAAALEYLIATRLPSWNYAASDGESRAAAAALRKAHARESSSAAGTASGGGSTGAGEGELREVREVDRLVHWCHGAPGVAPALAHAAMVRPLVYALEWHQLRGGRGEGGARGGSLFPSKPHLLQAAIEAGEVVWHRGLLRRVGLCHGISGNAYTFLALHRATTAGSASASAPGSRSAAAEGTGTPTNAMSASPAALTRGDTATSALMTCHLHRARAFAGFLHANWRQLAEAGTMHCGDHPFSLMEGLGGPACLFLDMSRPNEAKFPGYEL
ncbi:unnamed protein product [Closterium sp. NIES-53]